MSTAGLATQVNNSSNSLKELWATACGCDEWESHLYPPGVKLFGQDESPVALFFLEEGALKLTRCEAIGKEIIVDLKFSPSIVGAAVSINGRNHPLTATTVTSCKLSRLRSEHFREALRDSSISHRIGAMLSSEVLDQISRTCEIACLPARQRLENLLWQVCDEFGKRPGFEASRSNIKIQLPLRHWEAAQLLSITPTYLSRLLKQLEHEAIIKRKDGWIVVPRPEVLSRFTEC